MRALTVIATVVPAQLINQPAIRILVQADPTNTNDLLLGNNEAQVLRLQPGDNVTLPLPYGNLTSVWHRAVTGTAVLNVLWWEF